MSLTEQTLRALALRCLSRREYSTQELTQRLLTAGGDAAQVATLLTQLQAQGWLSDARFAEQFVRGRALRYGQQRLSHDLRQRGLSAAEITAVLPTPDDELMHARTVWQKKFCHAPTDGKSYQKQARFLQQRGFAWEIIRQVLPRLNSQEMPEAMLVDEPFTPIT